MSPRSLRGAFWSGDTRLVAQAIAALERDGQPVDPHIAANRLAVTGDLEAVGGMQGVIDITFEGGFPSSAPAYAKVLMELHRLRTVIEAADSAIDAAYRRDLSLAVGCMASAVDDVPNDDMVGDVAALADPYVELLMAREAGTAVRLGTGRHHPLTRGGPPNGGPRVVPTGPPRARGTASGRL